MNLGGERSVLSSLTLSGGRMQDVGKGGAVLYMTSGTVTNCILEGGSNYYDGSTLMYGGKIVDSTIRGAQGRHTAQKSTALSVYGGIVDRCIITNNSQYIFVGTSTKGEAVFLDGAGAIMRNCLVSGNLGNTGGGVSIGNAMELSSCTIAGNEARHSSGGIRIDARPQICANNIIWGNYAPASPNFNKTDGITFSCVDGIPAGNGNISRNPLFLPDPEGRCKIASRSPCVDAGVFLDWMADACDVSLSRRKRGRAPDMGCHETVPSPATRLTFR